MTLFDDLTLSLSVSLTILSIRLYFMPVKHYPPTNYVKRVRPWKLHLFTTIQVLCLAVLWSVKSSRFSLAFPFFLILMVPIRQRLGMLYKPEELQAVSVN